MNWIFTFILIGSSVAGFIFGKVNVWIAQGLAVQIGVLLLFSFSLFEKRNKFQVSNIPLALLNIWVAGITIFLTYKRIPVTDLVGKYSLYPFIVASFFPYFNFLCLLFFYKFTVEHLNKDNIIKLLGLMRYFIIGTLFLCVLQVFNLSQFYKPLFEWHSLNNIVTGFLGNGTHLSGFLGMCVPLFLWRGKREDILALILLFLVLCYTGVSNGDPSISGFIVGVSLLMTYLIAKKRIWFFIALTGMGITAYIAYPYLPKEFFSLSGRIEWFKFYWQEFHNMPITGVGLGKIYEIANKTPFPQLRHLHLEYFHYAFELGIVCLFFIINLIYHFFKQRSGCEVQFCLKLIVLGFLLSCLFNYASHLWIPSIWAMFCYASFMCIKSEVDYGFRNSKL